MDQYQYGTYEFWTYELEVQLKGHVLFNWTVIKIFLSKTTLPIKTKLYKENP